MSLSVGCEQNLMGLIYQNKLQRGMSGIWIQSKKGKAYSEGAHPSLCVRWEI